MDKPDFVYFIGIEINAYVTNLVYSITQLINMDLRQLQCLDFTISPPVFNP